jgi:hypothetical protein
VRFSRAQRQRGHVSASADPIEPSALVVRWRPLPGGDVSSEARARLLPIALAAGDARDDRRRAARAGARRGNTRSTWPSRMRPDVVIARTLSR